MNRFLITKGRSLSSSLILVRKVTDIKNRVASLNCEKFRNHNREDTHRVRFDWKSIGATAISIGLFGAWIENENDDVSVQRWNKWRNWLHNAHSVKALQSLDAQEEMLTKFGQPNPNLPNYTMSEVAKHRSKETRIWVAFQSGVYDITDFVDQHPGGDAILMGAGGNLEPFWAIYANHKTEQVLCILESYRIGNLDQKDVLSDSNDSLDPFRKDPIRHPALKVHTQKPFNAEAPTVLLDKQFLTPNELFFVRNHLPVPDIDINEYELEISGHGLKEPITLTYEHLQKLPQHTVVTTIQCAGKKSNLYTKSFCSIPYLITVCSDPVEKVTVEMKCSKLNQSKDWNGQKERLALRVGPVFDWSMFFDLLKPTHRIRASGTFKQMDTI